MLKEKLYYCEYKHKLATIENIQVKTEYSTSKGASVSVSVLAETETKTEIRFRFQFKNDFRSGTKNQTLIKKQPIGKYLHVPCPPPWKRQQRIITIRTQHTEPLGIRARLEDMQLLWVLRERVHLNHPLQDHNNSVPSQSDCQNRRVELQRNWGGFLQIVPHHHSVGREERTGTAAYQGEVIAAEEHLNMTDAALVEVATFFFFEGIAVVDAETCRGGTCKTSCKEEGRFLLLQCKDRICIG